MKELLPIPPPDDLCFLMGDTSLSVSTLSRLESLAQKLAARIPVPDRVTWSCIRKSSSVGEIELQKSEGKFFH